jgi:hypothetical protein
VYVRGFFGKIPREDKKNHGKITLIFLDIRSQKSLRKTRKRSQLTGGEEKRGEECLRWMFKQALRKSVDP